jgi:hypothetical protein
MTKYGPYAVFGASLSTLRADLTDDDARLAYGWWLAFAVPTFIG